MEGHKRSLRSSDLAPSAHLKHETSYCRVVKSLCDGPDSSKKACDKACGLQPEMLCSVRRLAANEAGKNDSTIQDQKVGIPTSKRAHVLSGYSSSLIYCQPRLSDQSFYLGSSWRRSLKSLGHASRFGKSPNYTQFRPVHACSCTIMFT